MPVENLYRTHVSALMAPEEMCKMLNTSNVAVKAKDSKSK